MADVGAVIAVIAQQVRQGYRVLGDGDAVAHDAQRGRILSGEHAHPAGHTNRVLHEKAIQVEPLPGQPVEVRGLDVWVAISAQGIPALLIGVQEQDIGSFHRGDSF